MMVDSKELEALAQRLCEGLARRDIDQVLSCYDPAVVLMVPGVPIVEGIDGLRQYYEGVLAAGVTGAEMRIRQVESLGDAVVEVGEYRMALTPPGKEPFEDVGKYLVVCRRDDDGRLRFWLDMFHSDSAGA
jgi:uncharacterized protein (TIGR02246 family)